MLTIKPYNVLVEDAETKERTPITAINGENYVITSADYQAIADVVGTNIKTINGQSLIGKGDIEIGHGMELINRITVNEETDRVDITTDMDGIPLKLLDVIVYYVLPAYDTSKYTQKFVQIGVLEKIKNRETTTERYSANDMYKTTPTHNFMYWMHNNGFPIGINTEPASWEYGTCGIKSIFKPAFKIGMCDYVKGVFLAQYVAEGYNCPPILPGTIIEVYGIKV